MLLIVQTHTTTHNSEYHKCPCNLKIQLSFRSPPSSAVGMADSMTTKHATGKMKAIISSLDLLFSELKKMVARVGTPSDPLRNSYLIWRQVCFALYYNISPLTLTTPQPRGTNHGARTSASFTAPASAR